MEPPEERVVTVEYLHELYAEIFRLKGENAACRAVMVTLLRDPDKPLAAPVPEGFPGDLARSPEMTVEEFDQLTERQQEILSFSAKGLSQSEVGRKLGISNVAVSQSLRRIEARINRLRRKS